MHFTFDRLCESGLKALFGPDGAEKFLTGYWPNKPFVVHGDAARLAGLTTYDFDGLVGLKKFATRAMFRTLTGASTAMSLWPGQERTLYDAGFTIYFHKLLSPALEAWIGALNHDLGLVEGVTRISAFASRRGAGLSPHYDSNDNFVCQARGVKRWRVAANTHVRYPTVGYALGSPVEAIHYAEAPNGFPAEMPSNYEYY